jgi:hypothetical protein
MTSTVTPDNATLLDVLMDGFEKNEILDGFHWRELPMPDEPAAIRKFEALAAEGRLWKGAPTSERVLAGRRVGGWSDLEIRQAGRGIMVRARETLTAWLEHARACGAVRFELEHQGLRLGSWDLEPARSEGEASLSGLGHEILGLAERDGVHRHRVFAEYILFALRPNGYRAGPGELYFSTWGRRSAGVQAKVALRLARELPEADRAALVRNLAKTLSGVGK